MNLVSVAALSVIAALSAREEPERSRGLCPELGGSKVLLVTLQEGCELRSSDGRGRVNRFMPWVRCAGVTVDLGRELPGRFRAAAYTVADRDVYLDATGGKIPRGTGRHGIDTIQIYPRGRTDAAREANLAAMRDALLSPGRARPWIRIDGGLRAVADNCPRVSAQESPPCRSNSSPLAGGQYWMYHGEDTSVPWPPVYGQYTGVYNEMKLLLPDGSSVLAGSHSCSGCIGKGPDQPACLEDFECCSWTPGSTAVHCGSWQGGAFEACDGESDCHCEFQGTGAPLDTNPGTRGASLDWAYASTAFADDSPSIAIFGMGIGYDSVEFGSRLRRGGNATGPAAETLNFDGYCQAMADSCVQNGDCCSGKCIDHDDDNSTTKRCALFGLETWVDESADPGCEGDCPGQHGGDYTGGCYTGIGANGDYCLVNPYDGSNGGSRVHRVGACTSYRMPLLRANGNYTNPPENRMHPEDTGAHETQIASIIAASDDAHGLTGLLPNARVYAVILARNVYEHGDKTGSRIAAASDIARGLSWTFSDSNPNGEPDAISFSYAGETHLIVAGLIRQLVSERKLKLITAVSNSIVENCPEAVANGKTQCFPADVTDEGGNVQTISVVALGRDDRRAAMNRLGKNPVTGELDLGNCTGDSQGRGYPGGPDPVASAYGQVIAMTPRINTLRCTKDTYGGAHEGFQCHGDSDCNYNGQSGYVCTLSPQNGNSGCAQRHCNPLYEPLCAPDQPHTQGSFTCQDVDLGAYHLGMCLKPHELNPALRADTSDFWNATRLSPCEPSGTDPAGISFAYQPTAPSYGTPTMIPAVVFGASYAAPQVAAIVAEVSYLRGAGNTSIADLLTLFQQGSGDFSATPELSCVAGSDPAGCSGSTDSGVSGHTANRYYGHGKADFRNILAQTCADPGACSCPH